ncbi:MAG TPA: RNA-binding protein [Acidimicrobiia bacterium]|nr:RNA-binding protein [Acidimicrobiia bacterium]
MLAQHRRSNPSRRTSSTVDRFTGSIMSSNIYVGNLTFNTTSDDLERLFAQHGEVTKAQVITDRDTGRSRGFGFVEMASSDEAKTAIEALNGKNVDGRDLTVNVAKERSR